MAVIDSYSEANYDIDTSSSGGYHAYQSFTGDGKKITSVQLYAYKTSSPTGNLTVEIYAHSGTFGTSSVPTGSVLATSDAVAASSVPASVALVSFAFSGANQITLANGTKYCLVLKDPSTGGTVWVGMDFSSPTHAGNEGYFDKDTLNDWQPAAGQDLIFYVNGEVVVTRPRRNLNLSQSVKRASFY